MQDVPISEFKAKCLGLIEQVQRTRQPLRITRHGKPVAEVVPAGPDRKRQFLGDMIGTAKIVGDIVSPVIDIEDPVMISRISRRIAIESASRHPHLDLEQVGTETAGATGDSRAHQS